MKDKDDELINPLTNSRKFDANTAPRSFTRQPFDHFLMKKKGEEFIPGDLVFAEFSNYSWPALVTQVGAKDLEVVTLILEQDELIDKDRAVLFQGEEQLQRIMSVLTPGEQLDFTEASTTLTNLSGKSREERLRILKMGRDGVTSESEEGESSKENDNTAKAGLSISDVVPHSNGEKQTKKLSCDIDDITLTPVRNHLEKIINTSQSEFNGITSSQQIVPNFPIGSAPDLSSEESEIEVRLQSPTRTTPLENGSTSKRKKLQLKQQRDEDYIAKTVQESNELLKNVNLFEGMHPSSTPLSYDNLKLARERAQLIAGCVGPLAETRKRRTKSRSKDQTPPETEAEATAKAHIDHLKATREAQKKALLSHEKQLRFSERAAENAAKRASLEVGQIAIETNLSLVTGNMTELIENTDAKATNNVVKNSTETKQKVGRKSSEKNLKVTAEESEIKAAEKAAKKAAKMLLAQEKRRITREKRELALKLGREKRRLTIEKNKALKNKNRENMQGHEEPIDSVDTNITRIPIEIVSDVVNAIERTPLCSVESKECSIIKAHAIESNECSQVNTSSTETNETAQIKPCETKSDEPCPLEEVGVKPAVDAEDSSQTGESSSSSTVEVPEKDDYIVDVVNFLSPYYLNLFTNLIKEQIENQIKLDLERLPAAEIGIILKFVVEKTTRQVKKQAYEIISKLVKNSPCQKLLKPKAKEELPEVGPGTPPASPKQDSRIGNKVIPRHKPNNKLSQDILHNPFPVSTVQITDKTKKDYLESKSLYKKNPVIPRTWRNYMKSKGRFASTTSPDPKKGQLKSPHRKPTEDKQLQPSNKRRKLDPAKPKKQHVKLEEPSKEELAIRKAALILYIKDLQINMSHPLTLKLKDVKWNELSSEVQCKYKSLGEKLVVMPEQSMELDSLALDLYVKSTTDVSRLDWLSLVVLKQKKFLRDAKKVTKKTLESSKDVNTYNEDLVTKILDIESKKRKRDSQMLNDPESTEKKEKGDGSTILDFICIDCFTLDYNPKLFATCHSCHAMFHKTCLESQSNNLNQNKDQKPRYLCRECQQGAICVICRTGSNLKTCSHCPYKYHDECVRPHMSTQVVSATSFICPYHVCGSCEARPELNIRNFVRCVRCPQSFHENHIPVGCMRISKTSILCYRHQDGFLLPENAELERPKVKRKRKSGLTRNKKGLQHKKKNHLNVPFCFQCTFGGDLICCEGCPASFHNECVPEDNRLKDGQLSWLCPDCIVGKKPFIGDIVWVKFGAYRWWPCQILDEVEVPDNIFALHHKPCQFPAICLGTKEFSWLDMRRVYSYEDGDKGCSSTSGVTNNFKLALIEAKDLHSKVKPIKEARLQETSSVEQSGKSKKPAPFRFIKVNAPYNSAMKEYEKQLRLERMPFTCDCTQTDKCSADSSCINRVLLTECPPGCRWEDKCENQRFARRQYPATKLVKTEGRGWGLVACQDISAGSLVHEYVGEIIDEYEVERRLNHYQTSGITDYYMLTVDKSRIIDAKPKANHARFMNHSCDPNCETQKWNVCGLTSIGLFAKRAISEGEELTFDYQFDTRGQEKKACLCGSSNCSGYLGVPAKKIVEPVKEPKKKKKKRAKRKKAIVTEPASKSNGTSTDAKKPPAAVDVKKPPAATDAKKTPTATDAKKPPAATDAKKAPAATNATNKDEKALGSKRGRGRPTKGVKLPVHPVKTTAKPTLKTSKKKGKSEDTGIEEDLEMIKAIVNSDPDSKA